MSNPTATHDSSPMTRAQATIALLIVLAGSLALRLWGLGARSVWTDEGSTWTAASAPIRELLRLCAHKDASPPLFYLLTWLSLRTGSDEFHLRLVSALASLGLVWLAYRLVRLFESRPTAVLAAALAGASPYALMFAQEARTYMLVALFTVASLYAFARAALLERRHAWWVYVVVTTLALYTQSIAVLGLGVQGALVMFTTAGRRNALRWIGAVAGCLVLYTPWLFVSAAQMAHLGSSHWYMPRPGVHEIVNVLRTVFVSPVSLVSADATLALPGLDTLLPSRLAQAIVLLIPGVPLAASVWLAFRRDARGGLARIAWAAVVLPLAAVLAVSLQKPLWHLRYFVFVTPFVAVLLALGASALRPALLRTSWVAAAVVLSLYACVRYQIGYSKEDWRDVAVAIEAAERGRSAVIVTFDSDPFRFYASRMRTAPAIVEASHPDVPFADAYTPRQLDELERSALIRTRDFEDVWVIVRSPNSEVRREVARRAERVASQGRTLVVRQVWNSTGGPLWVARYRLPTVAVLGGGSGPSPAPSRHGL